MIVALSGGVGAARLLAGLVQVEKPQNITAIVNTGDDMILHGLHISPDIDTVIYTLGGLNNQETGWGLAGETWNVMNALERLGGQTWFRLGDKDLSTHLYRTQRLHEGALLSEVTSELAKRHRLELNILPMSNDPVRTKLRLKHPSVDANTVTSVDSNTVSTSMKSSLDKEYETLNKWVGPVGDEIGFQEYFVGLRHSVEVESVSYDGASSAQPTPGVIEAIEAATTIVVCPSNPILSIAPLLSIPGVKEALQARRDDVVAVSPIIAGAAIKGPADRLMRELGYESSALGVSKMYLSWVGTIIVDEQDTKLSTAIEACGMRCICAPTIMDSNDRAIALARQTINV